MALAITAGVAISCLIYNCCNFRSSRKNLSEINFPNADTHSPHIQTSYKVKKYAKSPGFVGFFYSTNGRTKAKELCCVAFEKQGNKAVFIATNCEDDKQMGFAEVYFYKIDSSDQIFKNKSLLIQEEDDLRYPEEVEEAPFIHLEGLFNTEKKESSKGVGVALMTAIQQVYSNKFQGRIRTEAAYASHSFYYLLGFRSKDEKINKKIVAAISSASDTSKLNAVQMYLPKAAAQKWVKHVAEAPLGKIN